MVLTSLLKIDVVDPIVIPRVLDQIRAISTESRDKRRTDTLNMESIVKAINSDPIAPISLESVFPLFSAHVQSIKGSSESIVSWETLNEHQYAWAPRRRFVSSNSESAVFINDCQPTNPLT